eukprot:GGOE01013929.1.p1 GENE.GGOE01013929.1~~GGOE01013929.1.p1  ORF type:complete len:279 (-),score=82.04 GGOE01013929.1:266-1102(-)
MSARHLFALDFDGVVCDSADELYRSAFIAAKAIWPQVFADDSKWAEMPEWLQRCTRQVRPVLETGFEGIVMVRLFVDAYLEARGDPSTALAAAVEKITEEWNPETLAIHMRLLGVTKQQLSEAFGSTRDAWMKQDLKGWLGIVKFYKGTAQAVKAAAQRHPLFIITTKEQRFALTILHKGGVDLPSERVYGLGMYRNKLEVLQDLASRSEYQGCTIHFIEDRYKTLEDIKPHLNGLNILLYLATWGYNTEAVRKTAEKVGEVRLLSLQGFQQLLCGDP